jgi:hypothetical protein
MTGELSARDRVRIQLAKTLTESARLRVEADSDFESAIKPTWMTANGQAKELGQNPRDAVSFTNLGYQTGDPMMPRSAPSGKLIVDNRPRIEPIVAADRIDAALYLVRHGTLSGYAPFGFIEFQVRLKNPAPSDTQISLRISSGASPHPCIFGSGNNADCYPLLYRCDPSLFRNFTSIPSFEVFQAIPPLSFSGGGVVQVTIPRGKSEIYLYLQPKETLIDGVLSRKPRSPSVKIELVESDNYSIFEDAAIENFRQLLAYIVQVNCFYTVEFYDANASYSPPPFTSAPTKDYPLADDPEYVDFVADPSGEWYQSRSLTETTTISNAYNEYGISEFRPPDTYQVLGTSPEYNTEDPPELITTPITLSSDMTVEFAGGSWDAVFDTFRNGEISANVTDFPIARTLDRFINYAIESWTDIDLATLLASRGFTGLTAASPADYFWFDGAQTAPMSFYGVDGNYYLDGGLSLGLTCNRAGSDQGILPFELQSNGWYRQQDRLYRHYGDTIEIYYDWATIYAGLEFDRLATTTQDEKFGNFYAFISVSIDNGIPSRQLDFSYFKDYYGI